MSIVAHCGPDLACGRLTQDGAAAGFEAFTGLRSAGRGRRNSPRRRSHVAPRPGDRLAFRCRLLGFAKPVGKTCLTLSAAGERALHIVDRGPRCIQLQLGLGLGGAEVPCRAGVAREGRACSRSDWRCGFAGCVDRRSPVGVGTCSVCCSNGGPCWYSQDPACGGDHAGEPFV